ncbi:MAG TPA: LodA/GoxA family CTQ-dependent oxidase [Candidatus Acidoferrales bacterium]|nr:LodA/GoxA family CTQ-dependent oxidase [Candidatus Acidoferrales bacterium]
MFQSVKIFPPIGVARLGNSPSGYFIGPERPADPDVPSGGFRDANGLIKRQAARFRIYGFDAAGAATEINLDNAQSITWTVHVANTKAAADKFFGKAEPNPGPRNPSVTANRDQLKLDPGPVSVSGANPNFEDLGQSAANGLAKEFRIDQQFLGKHIQLTLGTATTDDKGRLLVLAGNGESKSPTGTSIHGGNFANHDGWYDDVADGVVTATVRLNDGSTPLVASAWVLCAPPKFAPGIHVVVTLYDTLFQAAVDRDPSLDPFNKPAFQPSIAADILPLLTRAANMRWVYARGRQQFNPATSFHHTLSSLNNLPLPARSRIFDKLSTPSSTPGNPGTGGGDMPKMWSDLYPNGPNGTLTRIQFKMVQQWAAGSSVPGTAPSPADPITPDGLTRAALDACVGAAFYPGIEASWKIRDVFPFVEPFRLDSSRMNPGDVTSQMSLPWQSDFLDCAAESGNAGDELVWWPAQRPLNVLKPGSNTYVPWGRFADTDTGDMSIDQILTGWSKLGFLVESNGRYEETQRG